MYLLMDKNCLDHLLWWILNEIFIHQYKIIHVDCYRLDDPQELFYLGLEEYLNRPDSIVLIEWADKIKNYIKKFKKIIWLKIKIINNQRIITIKK